MEKWSGEIRLPVVRTIATEKEGYNPHLIKQHWKELVVRSPGLYFILDLDENLFNTAGHWVDFTNTFLRIYAGTRDVPTKNEVYNEGGPSTYYPKHFPQIFPTSDSYEKLADEMRHRAIPNRAGHPMHNDMSWIHKILNERGVLLGGLTARPATTTVKKATEQQISASGLPTFDILYKPLDVPLAQISQVKLRILEEIANDSNTQSILILIDDSMSTAQVIRKRNQHRGNKPPIIQILNKSGPLTKPRLENDLEGQFTFTPDDGIFIMDNWICLPETINVIKAWLPTRN